MGALTIKPYAFTYRPWEIDKIPVANILSTFPEVVVLHFKNQKVMRITAASTSDFITNSLRFSTTFLNKIFFPKNNINLNSNIIVHRFFVSLFLFYFSNNKQPYLLLYKNAKVFSLMLRALFFFPQFFYKNTFNLNYIPFNVQQDKVTNTVSLFNSNNYVTIGSTKTNQIHNNILDSYGNFDEIIDNVNSNMYFTTDINLRERALDFYLNLTKLNLNNNNLFIFYVSKFKVILETKHKNITEYQISTSFSNKTLLFLTSRPVYLSFFHFFFSNNFHPSRLSYFVESPLNYSIRWLCLSVNTDYFQDLNDLKGKAKLKKSVQDSYYFEFNKTSTSFLNIFSGVLQIQDPNLFC